MNASWNGLFLDALFAFALGERSERMNSQSRIIRLLHEEFAKITERRPGYSLRRFSLKLGITAPALSEMMNGKRTVTRATAERIFSRLAWSPETVAPLLEGLPDRRRAGTAGILRFSELSAREFRVISDWWYFAILSLAETAGCRSDPVWVAERLNIAPTQAQAAIHELRALGLLQDRGGRLIATGKRLSTQTEISDVAIRKNHRQGLELAGDALDRVPLAAREFGAITLAIDPARIPDAKRRIREFRAEMSSLLETGAQTDVYRLQIQFFPLSQPLSLKESKS